MANNPEHLASDIDQREQEFEAIGDLITAGMDNGLLAELIWSFGQARKGGDSIVDSVQFAVSEWDV